MDGDTVDQSQTGAQEPRTISQEIAIAVRAAIDPLAKQFEEVRMHQQDFAKKTNKELMRNRLRSASKTASVGTSEGTSYSGNVDIEMMEERLALMLSVPEHMRGEVRSEIRGESVPTQVKILKLLTKRDASARQPTNTAATPQPVAATRGGAPQGVSAHTVAYPRTQYEFNRMSKESRSVLMKDVNFHPEELPRISSDDVSGY